jgi:hypothetical protein
MKVKAYVPGTENVLVGEYEPWAQGGAFSGRGGQLKIFTANGSFLNTVSIDADFWTVEPIIVLPTKTNAIIEIGDSSDHYRYWLPSKGGDWISEGVGEYSASSVLHEIQTFGGKFTVIFEGTDD